jgi:RNA polymerase sigma-70 factor, ECF subfamily
MGNLQTNTTDLLEASRQGQAHEAERLFVLVYDELRDLAQAWLRREDSRGAAHTLQPTALVHEAYLKLIDQQRATWKDRAHFLAVASEAIRRILVDHARRKHAAKRGGEGGEGGWQRITIAEEDGLLDGRQPPDLLALDDVLNRLAALHPRQAEVVKMKFFGGLSGDDIAEALHIDRATVVRDWSAARAWLLSELAEEGT